MLKTQDRLRPRAFLLSVGVYETRKLAAQVQDFQKAVAPCRIQISFWFLHYPRSTA